MLYPEGSTERTKRLTQLGVAAVLIIGLCALDSASSSYTVEKWVAGIALLYIAAMSDSQTRGLLTLVCALMVWKALS